MTKGGKREGAGRHVDADKRVSLTIRIPPHQKAWLRAPDRKNSAGVLIEWALHKTYGLRRPKTPKGE